VNKSPGTWKVGHFAYVIAECRPTAGTVDEAMVPRGSAMRAGSRDEAFFSLAALYLCVRNTGADGERRSPADLVRDGRAGEGRKGESDSCWGTNASL